VTIPERILLAWPLAGLLIVLLWDWLDRSGPPPVPAEDDHEPGFSIRRAWVA
jgi:hypothetical protein